VYKAPERRFIDGVMEDAGGAPDLRSFRRSLIERTRAFIGLDSAVIVPVDASYGSDDPRECVGVAAPLFEHFLQNQQRYFSALVPLNQTMARNGGLALNHDVYSATDRERLAFYSEIAKPGGITSVLSCAMSFRGRPLAGFGLNRHGRSSWFRMRDLERLRRVLPIIGMADTAVASQCTGEMAKIAPKNLSRRELQVARLIRTGLRTRRSRLSWERRSTPCASSRSASMRSSGSRVESSS
jgi:hypothetical protein